MNAGVITKLFGGGVDLFGPRGLFGQGGPLGLGGGPQQQQPQQPEPGMFGGTARGNGISVNLDMLRQAQFPQGMPMNQFPHAAQMPQGAFPSIGGAEAMDLPQLPQLPQRQPVLGGSMRQPFD